MDEVLADRTQVAAKLKIDQERLIALGEESNRLQVEVDRIESERASIVKQSNELSAQIETMQASLKQSTQKVIATESTRAGLEMEVTELEEKLAELKKQELALRKQMASMAAGTTADMNKLAASAAESLKELAHKTAEVQLAIDSLKVPAASVAEPGVTPIDEVNSEQEEPAEESE